MKFIRYGSIDAFRGLAILLMLFLNFYSLFSNYVPFLLKHNQGNVLLFGDLTAPFFQFLLGVSLFISFSKRINLGQAKSFIEKYKAKKFLYLVILGLALDMIHRQSFSTWGVLETLGLSGLITYLVLEYSDRIKLAISGIMLAVYALLSTFPLFYNFLLSMPHGSPLGVIAYTPITIIGTIAGKNLLSMKDKKNYKAKLLGLSISLMLLSVIVSVFIPFNKLVVSASFSLFAAGASTLFFLIFYELVEVRKYSLSTLREFGISSLTLWVMQFIFVYYPMTYIIKRSRFLSPFNALFLSIGIIILFYLITKVLTKYKFRLSL